VREKPESRPFCLVAQMCIVYFIRAHITIMNGTVVRYTPMCACITGGTTVIGHESGSKMWHDTVAQWRREVSEETGK